MTPDSTIAAVEQFDGSLVLSPLAGSDAPEIAWGDSFFYYAPDGELPTNGQPYATIVTKDYPDDIASDLDHPDRWRLNIQVDRATFEQLVGEKTDALTRERDFAAADVINPHPVYGTLSWISVVNPDTTADVVIGLLRSAHEAARERFDRRQGVGSS